MKRRTIAKRRDFTKYSTLATADTDSQTENIEQENDSTQDVVMPKWSGTVVVEGLATGDGRLIEPEALEWSATEEDPQLIRYVQEDVGAHDGAQVVGRIYGFERQKNGHITAHGDFDMGSDIGREAFRQVDQKLTRGVSVDLDDVSFEIRVAQEVLDEFEDMLDGDEIEQERETDDDGNVVVHKMDSDEELFVTTSARIRAATLVATPAFSDAYIEITDYGSFDPDTTTVEDQEEAAKLAAQDNVSDHLIASAIPNKPPKDWFANPNLKAPTALRVTENGQVFGHVATWDTCHIADPAGDGQCVTAPRSQTDYAYFHTGSVLTDSNDEIAVGHITMNTGHAKPNASPTAAMAHYDNTGAVVADVQAGEDAFGIWIAGALRSGVSEDQIRALRSAPLSGDWRRISGNLEMVAALAVNVPGFPIPRTQGLAASGATRSLTAAGIIAPDTPFDDVKVHLSSSDTKYLKRMIDRDRKNEKNLLAQRVAESKRKLSQRKVESFVQRQRKVKG